VCAEAAEYRFKSVCVNPVWVKTVKKALKGSGVLTCSVVGFPLGASPSDVKAFEARRALLDGAEEVDVVNNIARARANDQVGSNTVAPAAPDGYTLLVVVAAHAINPSLYPKMSYSPLQDLTGVSQFGHIPLLVVSSAQLPPTTLKDFVSWTKANPKNATFASSGAGSGAHLSAELFAQTAGVDLTHVPYKGMAPALPDLFSGQVAMAFDSVQTMMPHVKAGKLPALAIPSGNRRTPPPQVPPLARAGHSTPPRGPRERLLAPAKTPKAILQKLSAETQAALDAPDVHAKLIEFGIDPVGGTPDAFDAFI